MTLNPIKLLLGINKGLAKLEGFLLVSVLLTALFFAFLQVILRNFFNSGISWGDVFTRHLVLWIAFFGATLSTLEDKHIKIDALLKVIPKKFLPLVELIINIFCIIVSYLLFMSALKFVVDERAAQSILFAGIPNWYFIVIMPVGFALITFRYFIIMIEGLYKFAGKKLPAGDFKAPELDISLQIKLK